MSGFSIGIGIGLKYNRPILGKFNVCEVEPALPDPIASYRACDKTNDDEDRAVLKDLTGNGHDIQLYNFAFAESSGYGKYGTDFNNFATYANRGELNVKHDRIIITSVKSSSSNFIETTADINIDKFKINVIGIPIDTDIRLIYNYSEEDGTPKYFNISSDGIYELPVTYKKYTGFRINQLLESCNITIEQIPDYQGALVSDGVDDYGLCENFPILTKEKGYTVCAIRKWLKDVMDSNAVFLTKRKDARSMDGAFTVEKFDLGNICTYNFGNSSSIKSYFSSDITFISQTSKKYNEIDISSGDLSDTNMLTLFSGYRGEFEFSSIALYALEIYDRDLTDEEIATVKVRMIAEYEEKTGNKYEEETV